MSASMKSTTARASGLPEGLKGRCHRKLAAILLSIGLGAGLAGCIQVTAPDKPIEIVLNINIRQEVVYRLDSDAKQLIETQSEIF